MKTNPKLIAVVLVSALAFISIAGTKISQMRRTTTVSSNDLFNLVRYGADGRKTNLAILAPNLATNLQRWMPTNVWGTGGSGGSYDDSNLVGATNGLNGRVGVLETRFDDAITNEHSEPVNLENHFKVSGNVTNGGDVFIRGASNPKLYITSVVLPQTLELSSQGIGTLAGGGQPYVLISPEATPSLRIKTDGIEAVNLGVDLGTVTVPIDAAFITSLRLHGGQTNDAVAMIAGTTNLVGHPTVSATELGYLDGVGSSIQSQLDAKASITQLNIVSNQVQVASNYLFGITGGGGGAGSLPMNNSQFNTNVTVSLIDGAKGTNLNNVGTLNVTNNPAGGSPKIRLWNTNGSSYTEFTLPDGWKATNSFIWSVTNTAAGEFLKVQAVSVSGGVASIILTNGTAQPLDSDLTAIAALTTTSFGRGLLDDADATAGRASLGVVIGTDVQAWSELLQDLADTATPGFYAVTDVGTTDGTTRTMTGTALEVSVANGDGVSGNPTFSLPSLVDLGAGSSFQSELGKFGATSNVTFAVGDNWHLNGTNAHWISDVTSNTTAVLTNLFLNTPVFLTASNRAAFTLTFNCPAAAWVGENGQAPNISGGGVWWFMFVKESATKTNAYVLSSPPFDIAPGQNLLNSTNGTTITQSVLASMTNQAGIKYSLLQPGITVSNLTVNFGLTNYYMARGCTNLVLTNLVELADGETASAVIHVHNTTGVTMGIVWPAFGSQHGYHFRTNALNDVRGLTSIPAGEYHVLSFTAAHTNIMASRTQW